jgi:hypothetical protein
MKIRRPIFSFFALAVTGSLIGCATTGYQQAATTASTLTRSAEISAKGNLEIDETLAKLNDLIANPSPDLRQQFNAFDKAVNALGATAKDITVKAEQMKAQGQAYFRNWDKELAKIHNEDIRRRSTARKSEVAERFDLITQRYERTKVACIPYMSDLRDIQTALSMDLTTGGLAAIKDAAAKAVVHAPALKESISKLSDEFKRLGISMSSMNPAK